MTRSLLSAVILSILLLLCASAYADSGELLSFSGLRDLQQVSNFYNGAGLPGTPNYGVTFSSNFFGLHAPDGQYSVTSPIPANNPVIFICPGGPPYCNGSSSMGVMNVAGGFTKGMNFFYSAAFQNGQTETVTVWSGVNGTGTVLATIVLANNDASCTAPAYCNWSSVGLTLKSGQSAESVTFSGPATLLGITDITLNSSSTAIPEPSSIFLVGTGLAALSLSRVRKFFGV